MCPQNLQESLIKTVLQLVFLQLIQLYVPNYEEAVVLNFNDLGE